jgi:hypothetical protein
MVHEATCGVVSRRKRLEETSQAVADAAPW